MATRADRAVECRALASAILGNTSSNKFVVRWTETNSSRSTRIRGISRCNIFTDRRLGYATIA